MIIYATLRGIQVAHRLFFSRNNCVRSSVLIICVEIFEYTCNKSKRNCDAFTTTRLLQTLSFFTNTNVSIYLMKRRNRKPEIQYSSSQQDMDIVASSQQPPSWNSDFRFNFLVLALTLLKRLIEKNGRIAAGVFFFLSRLQTDMLVLPIWRPCWISIPSSGFICQCRISSIETFYPEHVRGAGVFFPSCLDSRQPWGNLKILSIRLTATFITRLINYEW